MKKILATLICILGLIGIAQAQQNYLITQNSVGNVRLGMTVAQARKALKGFNLRRVSDGDGVALIQVRKNGKDVIHLFAGEEDPDAKINEKAKIEFIEVFDANYKTADGISPEMLVKNAEKILGKVERVFTSEIEGREFVVFRKKPKGLSFRADVNRETGEYMDAGIYRNGEREGVRCVPTAYVLSIQIND
ncbi:MAG: hypothetical protein LH472_04175 [Pyrinomonadaceae bacterium]|nr:hypothetical protein [Pyrinomonadaceae bacterium]